MQRTGCAHGGSFQESFIMIEYSGSYKKLIQSDYTPLPIIKHSKASAVKGWAEDAYTPPDGYRGYGIGLKCGFGKYPLIALDLDILDKKICDTLHSFIDLTYGIAPVRVGRAPKRLLLFRTAGERLRKTKSNVYEQGHVECLAYGQEFVAYGIHDKTGKPYTWTAENPLTMPASELPVITKDDIDRIIDTYHEIAEKAGFTLKKKKDHYDTDFEDFGNDLNIEIPIGLKIEECKKTLESLNPDCDRDQWLKIGMALHYEFTGSDEALQLWDTWSSQGTKYKEGEPERFWSGFGNYTGKPVTGAYLLSLAEKKEEANLIDSLDWSLSRFVDDPPEVPMIIKNMLPYGVVSALYSAGGVGKSTFMLYMSVCIAMAKKYPVDFLKQSVSGGSVVVLTAEDPDLIINRRYIGIIKELADQLDISPHEARKTVEENLYIMSSIDKPFSLFKLQNDDTVKPTLHFKNLISRLKTLKDLKLIVIDTKTRFSPVEGKGNIATSNEVQYYEKLRKETGATVLLLHHTSKVSRDGSQSGAQAYRDVTAFYDSVRAAWYLRTLTEREKKKYKLTEEQGGYLLLENSKNNYIRQHQDLLLYRYGFQYAVIDAEITADDEKMKHKKKIIELMQTSGRKDGYKQKEILELTTIIGSRTKVMPLIAELIEDQLIYTEIDGPALKYKLTDDGVLFDITL